ncbi:methyl-accepting chemotaxis protein [Vibrio sp. SCSIO 43137]|uniref:methyl-accepting chemotaxis protein n=1 Tax=Vibrio sp. SCSIO 43137 TaxID=3021011 RepID=UPI0023072417|nr:methyl-accepting chemotaxis protein [Vibrio sp. SCSIO 43137]WCE30456.1 methyl-accepting chemotaxis protein [Vibrio sp. SCSIO 43137]
MVSIKKKSTFLLSAVSVLVLSVVLSVSYFFANKYLDDSLAKQIRDSNHTLSVVLSEPVFSYDSSLTNNIITSFIEFPYIYSLKAFDHRGKLIGESPENLGKIDLKYLVKHKLDISWEDGRKVGYLEVNYRLDANDSLLSMLKYMLVLVGLTLLVSLQIVNSAILKKLVITPIQIVADAMSEIAQGGGNLTSRLAIDSNDEVGRLARGFNNFASNLQHLVSEINESTEELIGYAEQTKLRADGNTISTHKQLNDIDEVTSALNEMTSNTYEISNHATRTVDKTKNCSDLANNGNINIRNAISNINDLEKVIYITSETISELKSKSSYINNIMEVIVEIADQTNLLALNAAIEAARAGEHGRGFAVVADEVRALAIRTQDSTKEIEQIVKELQLKSEEASIQMDETHIALENTVKESRNATLSLDGIMNDITKIHKMNERVAIAMEEQNSVVTALSNRMEIINSIATSVNKDTSFVGELSLQVDNASSRIKFGLSKFNF